MKTRRVLVAALCLGSVGVAAMPHGAPADANNKVALERQLSDLRKARVESARKALEGVQAAIEAQSAPLEQMVDAMRILVEAEVEMASRPEDEIAAWEKYAKLAKQVEEGRRRLHELGTKGGEVGAYYTAKQERERAEIELLKARLKAIAD